MIDQTTLEAARRDAWRAMSSDVVRTAYATRSAEYIALDQLYVFQVRPELDCRTRRRTGEHRRIGKKF